MTVPAVELHRVCEGVAIWHRYDAAVKADLFSTALRTDAGLFLVDPISAGDDILDELTSDAPVSGVVVTNANHLRSASALSERLAAPVFAASEAEIPHACAVTNIGQSAADLHVVPIEGAARGEIALHSRRAGGTLVLGDALINFGSHGFTFLPAKYATNPKLMRESLRQLLHLQFERILFAHGTPITSRAHAQLASLLNQA